MSHDYHFHLDQGAHSVTVTVRLGSRRELEMLVDGKEVAHERVHGHQAETHLLSAVLPTDPPKPVSARVELPSRGRGEPSCVLEVDGRSLPMASRVPA
ncbi:hypothetical protein [Kitasatospora sp. NPDC059571]|uniref:hypothetical protein n=1 Tax=Kitasatospora sp. NPDC059571 TaxID=3346871 RepID=UPI0036B1913E